VALLAKQLEPNAESGDVKQLGECDAFFAFAGISRPLQDKFKHRTRERRSSHNRVSERFGVQLDGNRPVRKGL